MNEYKTFQSAADRLDNRGWAQFAFQRPNGKECLVQSLYSVKRLALSSGKLSEELISDLHVELMKYPLYRLMVRLEDNLTGVTKVIGIEFDNRLVLAMLWNDAPWRNKSTVTKALRNIASKLEVGWLRDENVRLNLKASALEHEIARQLTRIELLERENTGLRRMTNSYALRADRRDLALLEDELADTWSQLESLQA